MSYNQRNAPPKDGLVRAVFDPPMTFERDAAVDDGTLGVLKGHFARFNEWTKINSVFEGRFMERVAPGAFRKTFRESGDKIKVLYDHGHDASVGNKVLGVPSVLREDDDGAYYEVPLFDTSYNRDLLPGLRANAYGASFRFQVMREDKNDRPGRTASNPDGLPERTITEARVAEFGPVTFPAYAGATAGMRSMTDEYILAAVDPDKLATLLAQRQTVAPMVTTSAGTNASTFTISFPNNPLTPAVEDEERAVWDTSYINDLPDSAFLYIEDGGQKDGDGKTTPRSLRHFPYRDSSGKVDLPHLRNALARIPDSDVPQAAKDAATAKAKKLLASENANSAEQEGEERFDNEDMGCLAQMVALGTQYIDEQDEPADQANIPVMQDVLTALTGLMAYEAKEPEDAEDENDDDRSADDAAAPSNAPSDDADTVTSQSAAKPLYSLKRKDDEEWRL